MSSARQAIRISVLSVLSLSLSLGASAVHAQAPKPAKPATPATPAPAPAAEQKAYEPEVGQAGKDVVWVPTPQSLVEKMLDMAKVTPKDYVIDLGSGDGRTVITAAKRGAKAHGIEYNPDMVELSKRNAEKEGVAGKATFEKADLFVSDFSKAQVVTMFLLPTINMKLRPTILNLKPGTRIVSNSFTMEDWQADETATVDKDCTSWCTAYLWIVPAKVAGTWTMPAGTLTLKQQFQMVTGTLGSAQILEGKVTGEDVSFKVGGVTYNGKVAGNTMSGAASGASNGNWTATRQGPPPPPAK
jgi:precorrin-6B methylase 2